jgi:hypothetical protein
MKKRKFRQAAFFVALAVVVVVSSCSLSTSTSGSSRVTYPNTVLSLVDITDASSYSKAIVPGTGAMAKGSHSAPGGAVITLVAEVTPPKAADGTTLQASHVALTTNGKYAFVSYMLKGDANYGAIDFFDVSKPSHPTLLSSTSFPTFDIAAVVENSGTIYLAGQTVDESGAGNSAKVMAIPYSGGTLQTSKAVSATFGGYFATDIVYQNNLVYVTTGTTSTTQPKVGLFALDPKTLAVKKSVTTGYPDLRSVAISKDVGVAVFEAQYSLSSPTATAHLDIYQDGDLSTTPNSIDLTKYPATAQAKSKIEYYKGTLLVAANKSGVVIANPNTLKVQADVPAPNLAGILPENQSSNAVSVGTAGSKDIVFIANGEAGLWVGDGDSFQSQTTDGTGSINGSIRFGVGQSVNYVASKNSLVVAAVGTGGLKVLTLSDH